MNSTHPEHTKKAYQMGGGGKQASYRQCINLIAIQIVSI